MESLSTLKVFGEPMQSSAGTPNAATSFEAQLIELLARPTRRVPIPVMIAALLIAGMAIDKVPSWMLVAWVALVILVTMLRWIVLTRISEQHSMAVQTRLRIAVLMMAISGVVHGSSLIFLVELQPLEQAVQSMILVGLSAACVATAAGYRPVFYAYVIPTLGPLALLWATVPQLRDIGPIPGLMALLMVGFVVVLDGMAGDAHRLLRESFEIRMASQGLTRDLRAALENAEAASRAKTRFLASASHDLRQPMQALTLFAGALEMRSLDAKSREITQHINAALEDLSSELDALLDMSKLDAGVVKVEPEAIGLRSMLLRIGEVFGSAAKAKNLQLSVDCPEGALVETDRKLFERVLRNLVENAIKYTDSGTVRIQAETLGTQWRIAIVDTGCGIPQAERERVFEEFYQLGNPERDRRRGLGLGLAIVKRLVGLLQIRMEMTSSQSGTNFSLTLAAAGPATRERTRLKEPTRSPRLANVLVVDDEEAVRLGMKALLEELGCAVSLAASTSEAILVSERRKHDMLIADFRLRGEDDGLKTILAVRQRQSKIPAILMTGETAPERLKAAQEAGVELIHKPVSTEALKRQLLRLSGDPAQINDYASRASSL
jgi:signal transduction histidine kinase/ActR/RegA family two-component response regulator